MLKHFLLVNFIITLSLTTSLCQDISESDYKKYEVQFREGDIVFQETYGGFSDAIKLATKSNISHCGLLLKMDKEWYVFEAVEPVKFTPVKKWLSRSNVFILKRFNDAGKVSVDAIASMKALAKKMEGLHYDSRFMWSDDRLYCSELVWKIYKAACGLELGTLQQLRDFDLSSPVVKQQMEINYGNKIPLDEKIISPVQLMNDKRLITVAAVN